MNSLSLHCRTSFFYYGIIMLIVSSIGLSGCLFVRIDDEEPPPTPVIVSPQPEIPISEEMVHSRDGDMLAFLPVGWDFINAEGMMSSDVFAIAANKDMNIALVFRRLKKLPQTDSVIAKQGVYALARAAMIYHQQKTAGAAKQTGKYGLITIGSREFGTFDFTNATRSARNRCAVFMSSFGNYYEIALVPLNINDNPLPSEETILKLFRSVLATVQY
jgi:hypothetical protein